MRNVNATRGVNVYLKPGEVIISRQPIQISTILGSCVAITMHSPAKGSGAICHAIFPQIANQDNRLHYVDPAIRYIYSKMIDYGGIADMVVKLFGGARVLAGSDYGDSRRSIGEMNVLQARETLQQLGLAIAKEDVGGGRGRKLLFSIKTGEVLLRRLGTTGIDFCPGE
ncbi:MAG TPA: chemotaxis protein CheD [Desulfobulbaceae bacterium]|nr:chemotaxis protein CheD [Desulfobulbaceae bacterium]